MKKARMNISHSRFIFSKLKIFGEIVTTNMLFSSDVIHHILQTYVVLNSQGTIFRFSKAKCLFLLDQNHQLRKGAIKIFTAPLFVHFITLVILCNCACMVLVEPPSWIENYLEYVLRVNLPKVMISTIFI